MIHLLQTAFDASSSSALVNLKQIALEIEESTKPPAKSEVAGWWLELIANSLSGVSYYDFGVDEEVVQKVTGTLSSAVFIAAQASTGPQGAPEAENFQIAADDFASELAEKYLNASKGLGPIGELIVSDYGKLTGVKAGGLIGVTEKTLSKLKNVLGPGSRSWSWQKLLPTSYEPFSLASSKEYDNPLPANAAEYVCTEPLEIEGSKPYMAFPHAPKNAQLRTRSPNEELGVLVLHG